MGGGVDFEWRDGVLAPSRGRTAVAGNGAAGAKGSADPDPIVRDLMDNHCDRGVLEAARIQMDGIAEMVRLSKAIREMTDDMDSTMDDWTVSASR